MTMSLAMASQVHQLFYFTHKSFDISSEEIGGKFNSHPSLTNTSVLLVPEDKKDEDCSDDNLPRSFALATQVGHSCKIGNTDLLGTSKNQNHQLCEICHFCLIFTLQQCIVAQKLIRQPYSSFSQHFVACLWEFSVPRRHKKKYTAHLARKSILSAQIKCKRHHLMLKSMSRSIYVLFFHFHLVHVQWLLSPRDNVQKSPFSFQIFISN